jgi:hypothetical protein
MRSGRTSQVRVFDQLRSAFWPQVAVVRLCARPDMNMWAASAVYSASRPGDCRTAATGKDRHAPIPQRCAVRRVSTSHAALAGLGSAGTGRHWCNVFAHRRALIRPGVSKIVTPNNDTLYSVEWLDLAAGPLVIDIPDTQGWYHVLGLLDMFTNSFAHLGTRLLAGGPRSVVVCGLGSTLSRDVSHLSADHVCAPTRWVWIIGRILVNGPSDLPAVRALQDGLRIRSLGAASALASFEPGCDPAAPLGAPGLLRAGERRA